MTSLVLLLALSQTELPPDALAPLPPPVAPQEEKQPPAPPSVLTRSLLSGAGGTAAGGVSLGIALLLVGGNPLFDPTFATAALASLMITGVVFALHEALGGRGEITLALLFTSVVMAGAAGLAVAIDSSRPMAPILAAAIGSLPAASAAVLALELTSPRPRPQRVTLAIGPTGFSGTF